MINHPIMLATICATLNLINSLTPNTPSSMLILLEISPMTSPIIADAMIQLIQGEPKIKTSFKKCPINPVANPAKGPYNSAIKANTA